MRQLWSYHRRMKGFLRIVFASFLLGAVAHSCDFKIEPSAVRTLYRNDGWALPPLDRLGKFSAPVKWNGPMAPETLLKFRPGPLSNLTSRFFVYDKTDPDDAGVVEIPQQAFDQDGKQRVMSSQLMVLQDIWRYDLDRRVVAYTVGLTPVEAHRVNGKWKIDGELGCIFYGTFVDDQGDGVFRLLAPGWMKPDLIPQWALKRDPV
jgi:hypothetical protein